LYLIEQEAQPSQLPPAQPTIFTALCWSVLERLRETSPNRTHPLRRVEPALQLKAQAF